MGQRTCRKTAWAVCLSSSAIERIVRRYEVSKTNEHSERCRVHTGGADAPQLTSVQSSVGTKQMLNIITRFRWHLN
jgi:hypothetical protein